MKIVVWQLNQGDQQNQDFIDQLHRGLKEDPDELHMVFPFSVDVKSVEIPTDGLHSNGYKVVITNQYKDIQFDMYTDGEVEN